MALLELAQVLRADKSAFNPHTVATKFTYPNPKFAENQRLGFSNFGVPRHINLYNENGDYFFFPRGLVKEVFSLGTGLEIVDSTVMNTVQFNSSKIILKDYQVPAVACLNLSPKIWRKHCTPDFQTS